MFRQEAAAFRHCPGCRCPNPLEIDVPNFAADPQFFWPDCIACGTLPDPNRSPERTPSEDPMSNLYNENAPAFGQQPISTLTAFLEFPAALQKLR